MTCGPMNLAGLNSRGHAIDRWFDGENVVAWMLKSDSLRRFPRSKKSLAVSNGTDRASIAVAAANKFDRGWSSEHTRAMNRVLSREPAVAQVSIGQPEEPASRWGYLRWLLGRGGADRDRSLDTQIQIVTPENIEFSYHVAGPFSRSLAFFLDFLIYWFACFVIAFTASLLFGLLIYPLFEELGISWLAEEIANIGAGLYLVAFFASYCFCIRLGG